MYVTQHFGLAMCLSAIYNCQQRFQRQQVNSIQLSRNWEGILGNKILVTFHASVTLTGEGSFPHSLGKPKAYNRTPQIFHLKLSSIYFLVHLL